MRFCAGAGVTQFLDIGSGLPTNQNVHQVAQAVNPDARVVYADIDPVVVNHAHALLSGGQTTAMAPGSYLVISHADVSPAHVVGTQRLSQAARELEGAVKSLATVPARTRDQITGFFGDLTLVEPGLTDIWAWRPDAATVDTTSEFMRILGAVARKD